MVFEQEKLITDHTRVISPPLLPEVQLYLAAADLPIWRLGENALEEIGIGTPFWAFAWAGGQALGRYLLDNKALFKGKRMLDFGSGSGIVAIAAKLAGAGSVLASDIDPVAASAISLNARLNNVEIEIGTRDLTGRIGDWDVILVGDVCYEKIIADQVFSWIRELTRAGKQVLVGDPGRFYLPGQGFREIAKYSAPTTSLMEDSDLRNARVWIPAGD